MIAGEIYSHIPISRCNGRYFIGSSSASSLKSETMISSSLGSISSNDEYDSCNNSDSLKSPLSSPKATGGSGGGAGSSNFYSSATSPPKIFDTLLDLIESDAGLHITDGIRFQK